MTLLAILWGQEPTGDDWARLSAARASLGWEGKIEPARAVPGSPGCILAIGATPDWLCDHVYVESTESDSLEVALGAALGVREMPFRPTIEDQLSEWMGMDVKFIGEEEHEQPVGFSPGY